MSAENNNQVQPSPAPAAHTPEARSRVFLVDDHAMFRDGLRQLIDREPDLTVCGDAATADEAMRGISETRPDLVIVDISLAGASGIDLVKALKTQHEDLPVLVVSMHDESL
jgi:DNA-binding NarL/FixJ family response regulator